MAVSGRNWGGVMIQGKSLKFMVDGRVALEVPLPDVAQVGWGGGEAGGQGAVRGKSGAGVEDEAGLVDEAGFGGGRLWAGRGPGGA